MPKSNLCKPTWRPEEEAQIRLYWNIKKKMELEDMGAEEMAILTGLSEGTYNKKMSNSKKCVFDSLQLANIFKRLKFSDSEILESTKGKI